MSAGYDDLLAATVSELESRRRRGQRTVTVTREVLDALNRPATRPRRADPPSRPLSKPSVQPGRADPPGRPLPEAASAVAPASGLAHAPQVRAALSRAEKEAAVAALRPQVLACAKCPHLAASRRTVVFGVGDIHAPLMFVGEAPGADEDAQGEPFVGRAGELLTRIIQTMGFTRATVFIANVLKCRPDTPGESAGNRKPTPEEMQTCLPWLLQQIDIVQPRVIVALGATAVQGLFGAPVAITKLRGQWRSFRGIPVMPTYHPAYLLRNQSSSIKRCVWEDMLQVLEKLGAPISAKQRKHFLKSGTSRSD